MGTNYNQPQKIYRPGQTFVSKYTIKDAGTTNLDINPSMRLFNHIENSVAYNLQINNDPDGAVDVTSPGTVVTTTTDVDSLKVNLMAPQMYSSAIGGSLSETSVQVKIYWKKSSDGAYTEANSKVVTVKGKTKTEVEYSIEVPITELATYDIKAVRVTPSNEHNLQIMDRVYLKDVIEILKDELIFPHTALLGVSIKATEFISGGLPTITSIVKGTKVLVPENYNPARRYMAGDFTGNFQSTKQWTDNPVWCLYDLITNSRYGLKDYFKISQEKMGIMLAHFYLMAQYCDERVMDDGTIVTNPSDPNFETARPRFSLNIVIDESKPAMEWLTLICATMRATLYYAEGAVFIDIDRQKPVTQLFNMSNITEFSENGASVKQLPNVYELQFSNKDKDYDQDTLRLEDPAYQSDLTKEEVKKTLQLIGVTDEKQAKSLGKYALAASNNLTTTVTFKTSSYGLNSTVGDVVGVQHDVPQWGYGGYVKSYDSTNKLITTSDTITIEDGVAHSMQYTPSGGAPVSVDIVPAYPSAEEQTTNVAAYPTQLNIWPASGLTVSANAAVAPDSSNSAFKLTCSGAADPYTGFTSAIGAPYTGPYTFSAWMWTQSGTTQASLKIFGISTVTPLAAKTFTITTTPKQYSVSVVAPPESINSLTHRIYPKAAPSAGEYFYVWGAQLEHKAYATAYTPTTRVGLASMAYSDFLVTSTVTTAPSAGDYYIAGSTDNTVRPFKVVSVKRDKDEIVEITGVDYNPDIYGEVDDLTNTPVVYSPQYSSITISKESVTNVSVESASYADPSGKLKTGAYVYYKPQVANLSWKGVEVHYGTNGVYRPTAVDRTGTVFIPDLTEGNYTFLCVSCYTDGTKQSEAQVLGDPAKPYATLYIHFNPGVTGDKFTSNKVTGLEVIGSADGSFGGRDCRIMWRKPVVADQSWNTTPTATAGSGQANDILSYYAVTVTNLDGTVRRSTKVYDEGFVYTHEMNASDGPVARTFNVSVVAYDIYGRHNLTATLQCNNTAPAVPAISALSSGTGYYTVELAKSSETDLEGYIVCASQISGFTPTTANYAAKGKDLRYIISPPVSGMWYIRVAAFDSFGEDLLNFSDELSVNVTQWVDSTDLEFELMKSNFNTISWAQFAICDGFTDSSKRRNPEVGPYTSAGTFRSSLVTVDATPNKSFSFNSIIYTNMTTLYSGTITLQSTGVYKDISKNWYTDEIKNMILVDSSNNTFTVTGNTSNTFTVTGGIPALGAYTLRTDTPQHLIGFCSYLDSTSATGNGYGYTKLEVSFDGGSHYQTILDTQASTDLLNATLLVTNTGANYTARITLTNDGQGRSPIVNNFLIATDPSPWRF